MWKLVLSLELSIMVDDNLRLVFKYFLLLVSIYQIANLIFLRFHIILSHFMLILTLFSYYTESFYAYTNVIFRQNKFLILSLQ